MLIFRHIKASLMPIYCAWCKKHLKGLDAGYDVPGNSHGICDECDKAVREEMSLEDYEKLV